MSKKRVFIRRAFLNAELSPSTGTIYAYSGPAPWDRKIKSTFLEIADCHQTARLHMTELDKKSDFINKLKIIQSTVQDMITFLEEKQ